MTDKDEKDNTDQKPLELKKDDQKKLANLTYSYVPRAKSPPLSNNFHPGEDHLKALYEMSVVKEPFYCIFCKKMCEKEDHYQFNEWWIMKHL